MKDKKPHFFFSKTSINLPNKIPQPGKCFLFLLFATVFCEQELFHFIVLGIYWPPIKIKILLVVCRHKLNQELSLSAF